MDSSKQIWRITLLYFAFGFAWIYFSDKALHAIAPTLEPVLQTYKGWIFVTVTTAFLFMLLKLSQKRLTVSGQKIELRDRLIARREEEKTELEKLTEQLRLANEELLAFNYSVSHDIKAPLRIIQGYSEMLYRKHVDTLDKQDINTIDDIRKSVKRINDLINNLLVYSSINKKPLKYVETNMHSLVHSVVADCKKLYPEKKFEIDIERMPLLQADESMMYQVLSNLISNAFKYSSKVEQPKINIGASAAGGSITFYIADNGTGFDMKDAEDIFKPFNRLHTQEYEGNGVGLAIVDRVMQKHNGRVWAESSPGMGSAFYFQIPMSGN